MELRKSIVNKSPPPPPPSSLPLTSYYTINTLYAITINPTDSYQFFGQRNRLAQSRSYFQLLTTSFPGILHLWIEYSEPRGMHTAGYNGPRLHAHGWFTFTNKKQIGKFLEHGYYLLLRSNAVDIDTINDMDSWLKYCKKQKLIKKAHITWIKKSV